MQHHQFWRRGEPGAEPATTSAVPVFPFLTKRYGLDRVRLADFWLNHVFPYYDTLPDGSVILVPGGGVGRGWKQAIEREQQKSPRPWCEFCVEINPVAVKKYNDDAEHAGQPDRAICADFLSSNLTLPPDVAALVKVAGAPMFEHQFEWEDAVRAAQQVRELLPPGAKYFFDVPDERSAFRRKLLGTRYVPGQRNDVRAVMGVKEEENPPILIFFHTPESVTRLAHEAGFVNVRIWPTQERMGWEGCFDQPEDWLGVECEVP